MIYTTISTRRNDIEYILAFYQNSGWEIVSRSEIGGSYYRIVLRREAKYLDKIGLIGVFCFIGIVVYLMSMVM